MKKRFFVVLLCAMLGALLLFAAASQLSSMDPHRNHKSYLAEILTSTYLSDGFSGRYYCEDCKANYYMPVSCSYVGMPIINIVGSLDGISKENKVGVGIEYSSADTVFYSDATLKLQGASSLNYPKKNYTVQFLDEDGNKSKLRLVDAWGKHSKYCLKANWIDSSQARNVVSARIYNEIVHSRNIDDELGALANGGVIDGYPVLLYANGELQGLYTMNIPKDEWMFGMNGDSVCQALLFSSVWSDSVRFREPIPTDGDISDAGWKMEYCSTEDVPGLGSGWAVDSMNGFIRFVIENDGEAFRSGIGAYTDIDRLIDVFIFTYFIMGVDNLGKNIIWASFDGERWLPSVYDLDATWGLSWDGSFEYTPQDFMPDNDGGNLLFQRVLDCYYPEVRDRYFELRGGLLSQSHIVGQFSDFFACIPGLAYSADAAKWQDQPSLDTSDQQQIESFVNERTAALDAWFGPPTRDAAA